MLLSGRCRLVGDPTRYPGCLVRSDETRLIGAIGRPPPPLVKAATAGIGPGWTLLAPGGRGAELAVELPGWESEEAVLHTLDVGREPRFSPPPGADVQLLDPARAGSLSHVPEPLRSELELALGYTRVVATQIGGRAVSFCYAGSQTERLWDVSIDTLTPWRRRGLASAAASRLIELELESGRRPVWGAVVSNPPSLRLAARLGFRPVDRLLLFYPPPAGGEEFGRLRVPTRNR